MSLEQEIEKEFKLLPSNQVTDAFIEENFNLMEIVSDIDDSEYIPNYMLWCVKNTDNGSLVFDYTVNALAEYGRMKGADSFKSQCNAAQKRIVCRFLEWCLNNVVACNEKQVERALRNWGELRLTVVDQK